MEKIFSALYFVRAHAAQAQAHVQGPSIEPIAVTYTINYQRPTCPHCHSSWITEHSHSPTQPITIRCWSCKRDLSGQLKPSTHFDDVQANPSTNPVDVQNTTHEREDSTL